jgi:predicted nucleic acid-binding protein
MLVIDASAVTDLLLGEPPAELVERYVVDHGHDLHAPHVLDLEVVSALKRVASFADVPAERADEALVDLLDLHVERYSHHAFVPRIWELRHNLSPYDASYLALAEALSDWGAPLLTTDARFARAAQKHSHVEVLLAA